MQLTIAIDPGAGGGIAYQIVSAYPLLEPMPPTEGDLKELLFELADLARTEGLRPVAWVEQVGGYVGGHPAPGSAMFVFGRNFGFILGVLAGLGVEARLITPRQWQKGLGIGTASKSASRTVWKNKLKAKAQQLYPEIKNITLKTADALLILHQAARGMV